MRVEVDVPNPKLELVPGMYAQASVALDSATDVLTVPVQAIDRVGDKSRVLVANGNRTIEIRDVELGLESAERVVVRSGLRDGDLVVLGNRAQLKPGMSVLPKVMPTAEAEGKR
jgi:multidrug efflux pump subunit AcrA (membrane-fusion protein)